MRNLDLVLDVTAEIAIYKHLWRQKNGIQTESQKRFSTKLTMPTAFIYVFIFARFISYL